jgi:hypothetical protein
MALMLPCPLQLGLPLNEAKLERVRADLFGSLNTSTKNVVRQLNMLYTTVHKVLRKYLKIMY